MKRNIYSYLDYRLFIRDLIKNSPTEGRGERKKLAEALSCQKAFITHVLKGDKDFNHEQALKVARYFNLNESERDYFLDLLSFNRAGTRELREFYGQRLRQKKEQYHLLKNRQQETQSLSLADQAEYYSHWLYGAIHMASTVPKLQRVDALVRYFNVSEEELTPIMNFLTAKGLVIKESGTIRPGNAHLFVGKESPLVNQHHAIWRVKALHDLKKNRVDDFHYSLCFSASEKDWPMIRERLLVAIDECLAVIRPSKEERLGLVCMDFQEV